MDCREPRCGGAGEDRVAFPEHAALIEDLMAGLSLEEKREAGVLLRRMVRYAAENDASSSSD